jgi:hypothetical protein
MKRSVVFKAAVSVIFLFLFAVPAARAQFLDSSAGLGAGLVKLFGDTKAFSAKADVRVYGTNRQETLRAPMNFALLDGKMRMDFDLATIQGKDVQPSVVKLMTQAGLNQVASIIRMDKRLIHVVFNRAQSYVNLDIPQTEAGVSEQNVQVQRTPVGKEQLGSHSCTRNKVLVKNAKGVLLLEATTWNAADMKDFPVQILVQTREGSTLMRFSQVQFTRPAAAQFEAPAKFTRYRDQDALLVAAAQKRLSPVTTTASEPAKSSPPPAARNSANPAASKPTVVRSNSAVAPPKTNSTAVRPATGVKPQPAIKK